MQSPPSAVLLDVGGVFLLPDHDQVCEALTPFLPAITPGPEIDRAHFTAVRVFPMGVTEPEYLGPLWDDYLMIYATSLGVADDQVDDAAVALRHIYLGGNLWSRVIPGSKDGLGDLIATGVPVGIVSNADGSVEQRLADLEILQVGPGPGHPVECVIDSGHYEYEKPDPRIFEPALEILEGDPADIWYLGDTPAFDIVGAQRAGLAPVLIDPFGVNGDYGVSSVRSLSDLARMVAAEN